MELVSKYTSSYDAKSWEGYLVLLTPSSVPKRGLLKLTEIRYDISRVRKLVATGDDIKTLDSVRQFLLPLLPLQVETINDVGKTKNLAECYLCQTKKPELYNKKGFGVCGCHRLFICPDGQIMTSFVKIARHYS